MKTLLKRDCKQDEKAKDFMKIVTLGELKIHEIRK